MSGVSGVWRILKRLGLYRLPASQRYQRHDRRWKRYEKAQPGHRVQIDVKFIEALPATSPKVGKDPAAAVAAPASGSEHIVETTGLTARRRRRFYQFTAIDDCSRLRVLEVYPRADQKTAVAFLDHVLARLPFKVDVIQTDNGAEFQSAFHWHALDQGLQHVYIKPGTPRLNGKVERSHRIDAEEFYRLLEGVVIDEGTSFEDKLREWEDYDNYHRPHGGLGGQTPMRGSPRRPPNPPPRRNQPLSVAHAPTVGVMSQDMGDSSASGLW
ncbi:DDE-type integrase/transposase/recombinase [Pseudonocardia oroxyli]|uniref:Integrase core domain-containing protein n=1 Tax=Pseudonocardia oroxyli TaxID=366584 RepID=A0A1G8E6S0_PSEOR|nr:DDE-type integrase/transposase/recombinase [Pseudonocardia oroxyli]SDH65400.1 Integrase core domain-containing protein [Pseudonocardia oroxyli]